MEEYWIVIESRTGRKICHCSDLNDAIMMVSFDQSNRTYRRHRCIMDQVIDITSTVDKQLPGQLGLPFDDIPTINPSQNRLPENQEKPLNLH